MTAISQLVNKQFASLANQVQMVHSRLAIANRPWRLCLAGGLASNDKRFQNLLSAELAGRLIAPASIVVLDPLDAALRFAAKVA
jgi:N-acetylglucosamine kinase-like BadF-type ATPase